MTEIRREIEETLDNIIFDAQQAKEAKDYDKIERLLEKIKTRTEHGKIAITALNELGQIVI
jgi:uncharacterized protein YheU (UPF0270 family)